MAVQVPLITIGILVFLPVILLILLFFSLPFGLWEMCRAALTKQRVCVRRYSAFPVE